jgi:hypothetical protein
MKTPVRVAAYCFSSVSVAQCRSREVKAEVGFDCNILKMVLMFLVLEYAHIARHSRCFKEAR